MVCLKMLPVRDIDRDDEEPSLCHIIGDNGVHWNVPIVPQHERAGKRLIIRIAFDDSTRADGLMYLLVAQASLQSPPHRVCLHW